MGKKKIKDAKEKDEKKAKKVRVGGLKGGERVKMVEATPPKKEVGEKEERKTAKKVRKRKKRSKNYLAARDKIKRQKFYRLEKAISLVKETSLSKFVGNLEAHLLVNKAGEVGEVVLPHFQGKEKVVAVADGKVVVKIKAGKIDFDLLLASPAMMPKLVPFARILGPKGLMPNPKNGTLVEDPEKAAAKFKGGALKIKTEKKAPVVHLVLGKLDQPDSELIANVEVLIESIGKERIKKMTLAATMGPGVKVKIE